LVYLTTFFKYRVCVALNVNDELERMKKEATMAYSEVHSHSSVGIALGYGLDDRGPRVQFSAEAGNFSLHYSVQNGSGAHPASYSMGTRGSFPEVKRPGREADHSAPSSAEVKE
jgi:hypothetical protein